MSAVEELLKTEIRLPSPPPIAVRILDLVKSEDYSFKQITAIIESDPALVVRILRLANSSFYGVAKTVNSIDKAISLLGVNTLKNIALSFILSGAFKGQRGERFDFERFSRRATAAAVAGHLISSEIHFRSDETFIVCLLQDIGVAAMFLWNKDQYLKVLDEKLVNRQSLCDIERQVFGFDHQEVGAELLKMWGLPESVYLPIRYHHASRNVPRNIEQLCKVIRVADRLSAVYYGSNSITNVGEVLGMLSKEFGFTEAQSTVLIDAVADKSRELLSQFEMAPGRIKPFSQILQEANEELARLNFSYEMLVVAHKQEKEKAERLAVELKAANDKLRHLAFRDGLTDLYNYRFFQDVMQGEIARAQRYKRPLALIMFDVDDFKRINDTYGHPGGDIVLQTIAGDLRRNTRQTDIPVRCGGDEFAIILPETNASGALLKAEHCRSFIEKLEILINGHIVHITISVGVVSFDSDRPVKKEELVAAADRALYQSKENGCNRVTAWHEGS